MLNPENFLEWEWRIDAGVGAGTFNPLLDRIDARVWRVNATTAAGGTITYNIAAPNPTATVVTLLAGTNYTAEPSGMLAGGTGFSIVFGAGIDQWNVEWIRRVQ